MPRFMCGNTRHSMSRGVFLPLEADDVRMLSSSGEVLLKLSWLETMLRGESLGSPGDDDVDGFVEPF